MKGKKTSPLRIVKNEKVGREKDLRQQLRAVHQDMESIIDLIDSSIEKEGRIPPIAQ